MAADDFNWDQDDGVDEGNNTNKNEDSDEFEKTVDHNENAFLDQQYEIGKVEKPDEPDSEGEGDFPFSDIDDALAGVGVPAEPAAEPTTKEEDPEPGELTSVSAPPEPEPGIKDHDEVFMELSPDEIAPGENGEVYDIDPEETLPPSEAPVSPQAEFADQFDPFVPATDMDEVAKDLPPKKEDEVMELEPVVPATDMDEVGKDLPPKKEDEIMELEPEVMVSPEPPAGADAPMEMEDEPLELDQKVNMPPQPEPGDHEEALSLEPEQIALEEDAEPMDQVLEAETKEKETDGDFLELGGEAMVAPETPEIPQPAPTDEAFVLDEQVDSAPPPTQDDSFQIERNESGAQLASQSLENEPVAPVEPQENVQADYTDMVVSNQEFLDMDEEGGAAPSEETRTKESQQLIDDKDLPNISTETELVEYTKTTRTGASEGVLQVEPGVGSILPEGPDPDGMPADDEDPKKFYRPEFTPEPQASKGIGIPPKMIKFGGIGLAAIIVLAILFLTVFKGKDEGTDSTGGRTQQQIADGKKPTGLRSQRLQDRKYNKYIREARKFYKQGMYDEAEKNVQLALKSKRTVEANNLLKDINQQTQDLKKKEEMDKVQKAGEQLLKKAEEKELETKADPEEEDFQKTIKTGTIEAMETYLGKYNEEAKHYFQVYRKLRDLKAESTRKIREEIKTRGQQLRRTPLRSRYLQLNQLAVQKKISEMSMAGNQFVSYTIGKDKVIVDYGTGLMWHLWKKPMNAGNSRLFSARRLAEYSNWRLPTVEELYSARRMNLKSLRGSAKARMVLWSGDRDYQGSKIVWALEFPTGKLVPANPETTYYLCAVRSIR